MAGMPHGRNTMQAIDDNKLQMEDCNVKLKHTRMQGFAALQVCERRLSLREKRPKDWSRQGIAGVAPGAGVDKASS